MQFTPICGLRYGLTFSPEFDNDHSLEKEVPMEITRRELEVTQVMSAEQWGLA